jgi:hypothetical protein
VRRRSHASWPQEPPYLAHHRFLLAFAGDRCQLRQELTRFIEGRLKLQVNVEKSAVARPWQRSFLGFTVTDEPQPQRRIADKAVARFKDRVRELTRRHRGVGLERMIADPASTVHGSAIRARSYNRNPLVPSPAACVAHASDGSASASVAGSVCTTPASVPSRSTWLERVAST